MIRACQIIALLTFSPIAAVSASEPFPASLRCEEPGANHALLHRTGESSRQLLTLKIYRLAHYTDLAPERSVVDAASLAGRWKTDL